MSGIEQVITNNLVTNPEYFSKVFPHLSTEYFTPGYKVVFKFIQEYYEKYRNIPNQTVLYTSLDKLTSATDSAYFDDIKTIITDIKSLPNDLKWLVDETESFCKTQAIHNAIIKANKINENAKLPLKEQDRKLPDVGAIPEILSGALSICFDVSVGHDYFVDYQDRWRSYTETVNKVPFELSILNQITNGGVELGTLNVILAGVNCFDGDEEIEIEIDEKTLKLIEQL